MKLTDGWQLCGIKILEEKMNLLPIYFHSVGHYPAQKHVIRPNGLGQYQICICTGGQGTFSAEGREFSIENGDIFFLSPNVGHEYYPRSGEWSVIWVVFNGSDVDKICSYLNFEDFFVCHADFDILQRTMSLCENLYETYNKNECYKFSLTADMFKLIEYVSKCEKINTWNSINSDGGFAPCIDYIKSRYMNPITLDELANISGLSKSHFCRQFKAAYSVTPMIYLNRYRISVAKFLLTTTIETIDVIAEKTGFGNASYFCAVFKKIEGCSPMHYRKRHER